MHLNTAAEVIETLGGISAIADLTQRKYPAAWNWSKIETFPADTFVVMTDALKAKGYTAPASLWRMVEGAHSAA